MDNAYRTMDLSYMESVIWVFKKLYDQDLIYKGMRISLFCPRCSTPVSNFEIAMDNSYADKEDTAIIMKFKVINQEFLKKYNLKKPCYFLAWTTTPWSCISVMGLAVGENFKYQIIETEEEYYIIAKNTIEKTMEGITYKAIADLTGKEISGLNYEHLFDYYNDKFNDFKTYPADYVSEQDGTGIVTINGAFGEVDMGSSKKYGLPVIVNVDEEWKFTSEVKVCPGVYVKEAEKLIIDDLNARNLLFKQEKIIHSYPFCYRCETPLIYRAQDSWFINVQKVRQKLLDNNQNIHWVPEHFKQGRFAEGIKTAPDWGISRTRYWATAMPVWECDKCNNREVFGSIADIEGRSKQKVKDLHRPFIDEIVFNCSKCDGRMTRVKEVLDCWMESGSMPYAERHYPFENKEDFEVLAQYFGDTEWISTKGMQASRRLFIYSEANLTANEISLLKAKARKIGHELQFHSEVFRQERSKNEKPLAFISHDSRDKEIVAKNIAINLQRRLCPVWYDEFSINIGENIRDSIEKGLKECKKCILVLSPNFISNKGWTKIEFDSIFTRQILEEQKLVLPVWYKVTKDDVYNYSPSLLNIKGAVWETLGEEKVCIQLYKAIMSD